MLLKIAHFVMLWELSHAFCDWGFFLPIPSRQWLNSSMVGFPSLTDWIPLAQWLDSPRSLIRLPIAQWLTVANLWKQQNDLPLSELQCNMLAVWPQTAVGQHSCSILVEVRPLQEKVDCEKNSIHDLATLPDKINFVVISCFKHFNSLFLESSFFYNILRYISVSQWVGT